MSHVYSCNVYFFFFSSRRRHTRWPRDWSSDVCSSDLFANSHANAGRKENGECRRQTGGAAGQAPQNHSGTNDDPARESIGEQTENRCTDHVSDKERVGKQAGLRHSVYVARCEKTRANIRLERGQDLPVDVIEKVDRQEQKESALRATQRSFPYGFHRNCRLQFATRRL